MKYLENKSTLLTNEALKEILSYQGLPRLSLYQSTQRKFPQNQQDTIHFGNLLKELEGTLAPDYTDAEIQNLLAE